MKELKFKTSKGSFVVYDDSDNIGKFLPYDLLTKIGYVNSLTEEQASEIVDNALFDIHFRDYLFIPTLDDTFAGEFRLNTAIESLHSLLKSKGIHLYKNPYTPKINPLDYRKSQEKTFHNPYIFKIND